MKQDPKRNPDEQKAGTTKPGNIGTNSFGPKVPARRDFLRTSLIGGVAAAAAASVRPVLADARELSPAVATVDLPSFELDEATITDLQDAMKSGKYTARSITEKYLARIDQIDKQGPALNSIIELNPDALAIADALDKERKDKGPRGPLHGIPMLIKDNIRYRGQNDDDGRITGTAGF